jgi:DNA-binding transcriptional regulator/RsmH inhibitor MraZ
MVAGVGPLIELWNKPRFDQEMKLTQKNFREIASSVVELGTS